jgi:AcrR family transcriptional regulator
MAGDSGLKAKKAMPARESGWQAEKSAMTRTAILEATIECFIELGYANTTTAKIADYAGVSRGAMMHHFPSRIDVLKAAVEYIHAKRIEEYRQLMANIDVPGREMSHDIIAQSVENAWKYVNLPSFIAYQELLFASRTDEELNSILQPVERDFEQQFHRTTKQVFPHWENLGETLDMTTDLVTFVMQGMALSHMASRKDERARRMLDYVTDQLEQAYQKAAPRKRGKK